MTPPAGPMMPRPGGQMTPPGGQMTSPGGQMTPPEGQTTPPEGQMTPPEGQMSPSGGQMTPSEGQMTPPEGQMTPSGGQMTPPGGQMKAGGPDHTTEYPTTEDPMRPRRGIAEDIHPGRFMAWATRHSRRHAATSLSLKQRQRGGGIDKPTDPATSRPLAYRVVDHVATWTDIARENEQTLATESNRRRADTNSTGSPDEPNVLPSGNPFVGVNVYLALQLELPTQIDLRRKSCNNRIFGEL